jgi:hypothetical protein
MTMNDFDNYNLFDGPLAPAAGIVSPPGTYLPPGGSAPVADPPGTYSAAGASAPTTDPAGTYSSPYALDRLIIVPSQNTPDNVVLSFNSAVAVENYYGVKSPEATLAKEFFAGYAGTSATLSFTRFANGQRPHLLGANISSLTLSQLQSINGALTLTFDTSFGTFTYTGNVDLSGVTSFSDAALDIRHALNSNLQTAAVTTGSSITPESVSFTGYTGGKGDGAHLYVKSVSSGAIEIGGMVSAPGLAAGAEIIDQLSGTPGGPGEYAFENSYGLETTPEAMTETYGKLTVGSVTSGAVAIGEKVTGSDIPTLTAVDANISGAGPGSTWVVNNALSVRGDITMTAPTLTVENQFYKGATENNDFFEIQPNGVFGFNQNPSSMSYVGGSTAATELGLTQASGAIDSSPGGEHFSVAQYMDNVLNETNQFGQPVEFGSFQSTEPRLDANLAAWAQSIDGDGYQFLTSHLTTPPAGSSTPVTDPAGTYSPAGASAPTFASPGTAGPGIHFKGPFTSKKGFDTAIDSINASTAIQDEAKTYEANVWGSDTLSKYVAPYGPELQFWVESPTLQINVQVLPATSPIPPNATQSESVFLQEINSIEPDASVAKTTYNDINRAYADSLGQGAIAGASGNTLWAWVFEPTTTTVMMVHPV